MADVAIEIFVEKLERLILSCSHLDFTMDEKEQLQSLHDELGFLRDFLENSEDKQDEHAQVKQMVMQVRDVAYKAETIIDWFMVEASKHRKRILATKPGFRLGLGKATVGLFTGSLGLGKAIVGSFMSPMGLGKAIVVLFMVQVLKHKKKIHENVRLKDVATSSSVVGSTRDSAPKLKAETIIDWFMVEASRQKKRILPGCRLGLGEVRQEIETITTQLKEIYEKKILEVGIVKDVATSSSGGGPSRDSAPKLNAETISDGFMVEAPKNKKRILATKPGCRLGLGKAVVGLFMAPLVLGKAIVGSFMSPLGLGKAIVVLFMVQVLKHKKRILANKPACSLELGEVRKEIETITTQLKEIYEKKILEVGILKDVATTSSSGGGSLRHSAPKLKGETVVGFQEEATRIKEELVAARTQLTIISIVGAPGAGKTTLARKVYEDRLIEERFKDVRGWIVVSQAYNKKDLLTDILKSTSLIRDGDANFSYDELGEQLFRRLRDKKYLIVIDDIWSIQAWLDIKRSLPDDRRGSRVLLTTRLSEVGNIAQYHHDILPLPAIESYELLLIKVFGTLNCPLEFQGTSMAIAAKCRGLPLAIVLVAGILAKTPTLPWWKHVAESLSSTIARNEDVCMYTISLSYNYLSVRLKACFLYLGAFLEDEEIPVRKLILLWIAEGFVKLSGEKSLEDIAEDYLIDLVNSSLIMVARYRSDGGVKACRIHDLLREFCLRKAKEHNFLRHIKWVSYDSLETGESEPEFFMTNRGDISTSEADEEAKSKHRRLCVTGFLNGNVNFAGIVPNLRTLLTHRGFDYETFPRGLHLLSVLHVASTCNDFHSEIEHLVHLRYLALRVWARVKQLRPSISNLWNLETLLLYTDEDEDCTVGLPAEIGNMKRLRHLCVKGRGRYHFKNPRDIPSSASLDNLQSLTRLCSCKGCLTFLKSTPNLKKLGIWGNMINESGSVILPRTNFLEHLETLKIVDTSLPSTYTKVGLSCNVRDHVLPLTLRKLTLNNTRLQWEDLRILGQLPHLEVLKLLERACGGRAWDTYDDEFCQLKYLRIERAIIREWNSWADHFPKLETLVLRRIPVLVVFPSEFADIPTLETIEVDDCGPEVDDFARQIKEEHYQNNGDYRLKVLIKPSAFNFDLYDYNEDDDYYFGTDIGRRLQEYRRLPKTTQTEVALLLEHFYRKR